ncbi:MAG: DinB family protein [Vicinamibacterales bacterium]
MLAHHRRLLAFDHWANRETLAAIEAVANHTPRAVTRMAHIMAAKRLWYARVAGTEPPYTVDPALSVEEIRSNLLAAHDEWMALLDTLAEDDLARVIAYTTTKGDPYTSTLGDILAHLPLHGQHHRGQALLEVRAAGGTPPSIDFIHAARQGIV